MTDTVHMTLCTTEETEFMVPLLCVFPLTTNK